MAKELRRKGVTLRLLWEEYRADQPDGFGYSWFCDCFRDWSGRLSPTMRQSHRAGERLFVDYAGQTVPIVDPQTGEVRDAQTFIAVAGASTLVASQIPVAEWHAAIGDATLADAILDRLVHSSNCIEIRGESMRKRLAQKTLGA